MMTAEEILQHYAQALKVAAAKVQEANPLNEEQANGFGELMDIIEQSILSTPIVTP